MKKDRQQKDHPEIIDIKSICDVSPKANITKDVCEKIKNEKTDKKQDVKNKR